MKLFRLCSVWMVGCLALAARADEGTLFYDSATGEVFLDIQSENGQIVGFDLRSAEGLMITDNYLRLGDPTLLFFVTETYLSDASPPDNSRPDGLYGIGPIFPPGMSEADFLSDVTSANWGRPGTSKFFPFEIDFGQPTGIPINDPDLPRLQSAWAESVALRYFAPTGELTLDTTGAQGGYISHLVLMGDFLADQAVSPGFDVWEATDELIYGLGLLDHGVYELGALLEPGLSPEELTDALSQSGWKGPAGVGISGFDVGSSAGRVAFALVHVPEPPGGLGLMCLMAILFASALRRRR